MDYMVTKAEAEQLYDALRAVVAAANDPRECATAAMREAVRNAEGVLHDIDKEQEEQKALVKFREKAVEVHYRGGECEVDSNAIVSVSEDGGAYVQAWVWVYGVICSSCGEIADEDVDEKGRCLDCQESAAPVGEGEDAEV